MIVLLYKFVDDLWRLAFDRPKQKELPFTQTISVVQYPDRILFETYYKIINSYSIRSKEITILEINSSSFEIGKTIHKHLDLSKTIKKFTDKDRKENDEAYKKITGLKSIKAQMKDSLYVSIKRQNNQITFSPTINGGTAGNRKGYQFLNEEEIVIGDNEDFESMGKALKLALKKCS
ncbi:contact-dependent growth inhibition system immunity protein [Flavobacterium sp. KACC 22758]|uniref:contact-dependent growth inhibition system immunity protein n=1 Tax=Flavobacterium sp. KACC 22758 TaxID=3025667 RepID=UPI0023672B41|nr:contact-dependent growth inhibition system immunity protein [Flavobacterium sp. KACC 22758]WDF61764.1 contact-dependent growth inhibition system immunity protein [Flavobacterium sp. KACC 22758]